MASLAGRSLVSSYKELLKLNNLTPNSGVSASLQTVEDGFAGATALQLSNAGIASTGTLAVTGDLSVNTNKFNVVAASGNTSIAGSLTATGDLAVNTNKFNVTAASGNTEVAGTLAVTGASTLNALGATTGSFSSTLSATGNLAINTNKFTVTAASGNTAAAGTLSAVGDFAINTNKFTVTAASGNVSSAGTLSVTGDLNVNTSKFSVLASTGNTSISGTLTVADTVDFASTGAMRIPRGTAGQRPAGDTGMLRFNTNTQSFEGHNGVAWGAIGGSGGVGTSQYVRQTFVATAGQTSFTVTGGYTPDSVDVFQNGVKLVNGSGNDVTITSGTAVVLATGAAAGDVIDVIGLASGNFAGPATAKRQNFIATASQTVFTVTGGYTPNQLDVFQNGTKLVTSVDVDVSNGSTFTLTTPAVAGDNLEVVGFTAANTIAGTLKFQAGTAAAPSITRFEDENTGIFFPVADTIAFSKGGAESMRINSSGNVGIGTTNPAYRLNVQTVNASGLNKDFVVRAGDETNFYRQSLVYNNSASPAGAFPAQSGGLYWEQGGGYGASGGLVIATNSANAGPVILATADTERMRINTSGNVGIGTTNPADKLDVYGLAYFRGIEVGKSGQTGNRYAGIDFTGDDTYTDFGLRIIRDNVGANANNTIHTRGTGQLALFTQEAGPIVMSTTSTERLRIDSSGNVGIGTVSPVSKLHVSDAVSATLTMSGDNVAQTIINRASTDSSAPRISLRKSRGSIASPAAVATSDNIGDLFFQAFGGTTNRNAAIIRSSVEAYVSDTDISSSLSFLTSTAGGATATEKMRITAAGNVGIGITTPSAQLELSTDSAKKPSTNTWTITSDQRLKTNITNADNDRCYEIVKQVPLKRYTWKSEVYSQEQVADRSKLGWIAQDVEAVFPKAVGTNRFAYNQVFEDVITPELDSDGNAVLDENGVAKTSIEKRLVSEDVIEDCKDLNSDQIYAAMYGTIQKLIEKVELLESKVIALEAA